MRAAGIEISGDLVAAAKVHLVRRLAREGCVRDDGIVLFDVEGDQPFQVREGIELMQVVSPEKPPESALGNQNPVSRANE